MKKAIIVTAIIFSFLACQKSKVEEPDTPVSPDPPVDTFALTGKILFHWSFAHAYGIKYKALPFGKTGLLPGVNAPARWSHKGDKIAVSDWSRLLVLDAVTLDTLYNNTSLSNLGGFTWSPDDSKIAFTINGTNKIQLFNLQTHAWKNLYIPNNYKLFGMLDWSGINDLLVFTAETNEATNPYGLFTVRSDGTNTTPISYFASSYNVRNPRFSPKGTTIAFDVTDLSTYSIFLVETTGQSLRKYWDWAVHPCWSADGNFLMANVTHPNAGKDGEDIDNIEIKDMVGNHGIRKLIITEPYPSLIDWWP